MPRVALNANKIYSLPEKIFIKTVFKKILVISPETANWLVLNNETQKKIYEHLSNGFNIAEVIKKFPWNREDILAVLKEIEAKNFESLEVNYPAKKGMYIYLTNRCNERCRHCYMYAGEKIENELSTDEVKNLLRSFAENQGQLVTFTGGEATTREDLSEILQCAKNEKLTTCLLTNGILLNRNFVERLKNYVDEIQISLDGYDSQSYFAVRQVDAFDQVLSAIDNAVKANIRTTVAVTPLQETLIGHTDDYIKFINDLREKYADKIFFVKLNTELLDGRDVKPTNSSNDIYRNEIRKILSEISPFSSEEGFAIDHRNNTGFNNCGYGGLTISANGDVYGCNLINLCALQGNIRDDKFDDILQRMNKIIAFSNIDNLYPCCECELKLLCGGGCRIKNFSRLVNLNWKDLTPEKTCIRERTIECTTKDKEKIYRMMILSNRLFYR